MKKIVLVTPETIADEIKDVRSAIAIMRLKLSGVKKQRSRRKIQKQILMLKKKESGLIDELNFVERCSFIDMDLAA